jgi:hypothetical protein
MMVGDRQLALFAVDADHVRLAVAVDAPPIPDPPRPPRSTAGRSTAGRSAAGRSPAAAGHAALARRPGRRKAIGSAVASLEQVTVRVAGEAARREQLQECAVYDRSKPAQGKMLRRAAAPPTPLK